MLWSGQGSNIVPSLVREAWVSSQKSNLDGVFAPKAESCGSAKEQTQLGLSFLIR